MQGTLSLTVAKSKQPLQLFNSLFQVQQSSGKLADHGAPPNVGCPTKEAEFVEHATTYNTSYFDNCMMNDFCRLTRHPLRNKRRGGPSGSLPSAVWTWSAFLTSTWTLCWICSMLVPVASAFLCLWVLRLPDVRCRLCQASDLELDDAGF